MELAGLAECPVTKCIQLASSRALTRRIICTTDVAFSQVSTWPKWVLLTASQQTAQYLLPCYNRISLGLDV
jgi:hypothetical protein